MLGPLRSLKSTKMCFAQKIAQALDELLNGIAHGALLKVLSNRICIAEIKLQ